MTPRRIIAPITFAADSLDAATVAAELASSLGAELVLAGIAPLASPVVARSQQIGEPDSLVRRVEEQKLVDHLVVERTEQFAGELPSDVHVRTLLTWGPVGAALVTAAADEDADLVVVPIRRESELSHLFHDHADRYVLHHSHVPVLVVPTEDGDRWNHPLGAY